MSGITHNDIYAERYVRAFQRRPLEQCDEKNPRRLIWDSSGRGETRTHDLTDVNPVGINRYYCPHGYPFLPYREYSR